MSISTINTRQIIPVLGMSCASCAGSAQHIIEQQNGVITAEVNFASGNLIVEYNSSIITIEALQKSLQSAGFDLLLPSDKPQQEQLDEIHLKHLKKLKTKTIWSVIFTLPVVIVGMSFMHHPYANMIMFIGTIPVIFWLGRDFFIRAFQQLQHRNLTMDTLVAISTGIAFLFSTFNLFFGDYWLKKGLTNPIYFEAASVIITFILLGRYLEEKAKGNTSNAIKKLIGLQPQSVILLDSEKNQIQTPIEDVVVGDSILVKPGEKIAVDGTIISGSSYIDESSLSGEPIAVFKTTGDAVYAGTINQKGSFEMKSNKVGNDTLLAQIIKTVQEAQSSKAPVQKLVDKIASIFVPIVISVAILSFVFWYLFADSNSFSFAIMSAVTVLIIACPCALGLATPTAIMVGIGKAAENGILIKDAESLEYASKIDTIILDKTGTITQGKPKVNEIAWLNNNPIHEDLLYNIEILSEHPLAEAITNYLINKKHLKINHFQSFTGSGVTAYYQNQQYFVGNLSLLQKNNIEIDPKLLEKSKIWLTQSQTVIWFANSNTALSVIGTSDFIKPSSPEAIKNILGMNIDVIMLTGDNEDTAKNVAQQVGITKYKAEMLPQDKASYIKNLQQQGNIVAMVGDGINDTTALATADVSIAMGKGSDIAMDVAKMTIISSDLNQISKAIQLSKMTSQTIRQNLFWAFIYNIIGIPIAAGILYPINGFLLNPMLAGLAMALSSVSVVTNSLRLKLK